MKGPERPCYIKPQQTSSRNVLQRSVEPAAQSGHSRNTDVYQQPDIPENRLLTPELYSRPGRLSFGRLTGATSRRSICVHRQGELKRGPVGCVCRGPQPATVGFHNRTADRESHAHAAGFGGEEGVEQAVGILGGDGDAAIRRTYNHL